MRFLVSQCGAKVRLVSATACVVKQYRNPRKMETEGRKRRAGAEHCIEIRDILAVTEAPPVF